MFACLGLAGGDRAQNNWTLSRDLSVTRVLWLPLRGILKQSGCPHSGCLMRMVVLWTTIDPAQRVA